MSTTTAALGMVMVVVETNEGMDGGSRTRGDGKARGSDRGGYDGGSEAIVEDNRLLFLVASPWSSESRPCQSNLVAMDKPPCQIWKLKA
ncbi:hypothetical protein NL676_035484 [Syzygium grande]|nr:hypothetical protein NL676_035484 [Syzygium grande]